MPRVVFALRGSHPPKDDLITFFRSIGYAALWRSPSETVVSGSARFLYCCVHRFSKSTDSRDRHPAGRVTEKKMTKNVKLQVMDGTYCISRLKGDSPIPAWADGEGFVSISRNGDELSIVCRQERVPSDILVDLGWICLKVIGPFAFDETGIVLSVIKPLSENSLGIFVVSTFDADCMLLKRTDFERAARLLEAAGHTVVV
jgi:uncharacterized protein